MRTMMKVIDHGGAADTILRISAAMRPASSATPMPIIATRMTATTPKSLKFWTTVVKINRMPSPLMQALDLDRLGRRSRSRGPAARSRGPSEGYIDPASL